jgi:NhaC family Na+:H+ antiporter
MTKSETKNTTETGRTPSMFASLLTLGVMVVLILLSVAFFGGTVADGPLQVSMTLATLFALSVAYYYNFRGSVISQAIADGVNGTIGTIFVILAIGTVIGTLYLSGSVAAFVYYGSAIISPRFFFVTVFILASILSRLLGSSLTTVGAVGIAFVGLASIMGVSPAIAAGAAVSGAIFGNKVAPISDTANLTVASVGGLTINEHAKVVTRTAIPTWILSAVLFLVLGFLGTSQVAPADIDQVQSTIGQYYNISLLAFTPVILIFVLSMLRFSAFMSLMLSAIYAVILAAFTQSDLIVAAANDPSLSYLAAAFKVSIDTLGNGFSLGSGVDELDTLFSGGGAVSMLTTVWLVLVAASFGAVTGYTGMLQRIITPVINWTKGPASLILTTMLTSIGMNLATADPYSSIVLTSKMFRQEYIKERLKPVLLTTAMADSGTIVSHIIPWNLHGAVFAGTLGIATLQWAPYTFFAYLTPVVTFVMVYVYYMRKNRLADDQDAEQVYGEEPSALPAPELDSA